MIYKLIVTKEATIEFDELADWYINQSSQATDNFYIELIEVLAKIKNTPFRYKKSKKNFR